MRAAQKLNLRTSCLSFAFALSSQVLGAGCCQALTAGPKRPLVCPKGGWVRVGKCYVQLNDLLALHPRRCCLSRHPAVMVLYNRGKIRKIACPILIAVLVKDGLHPCQYIGQENKVLPSLVIIQMHCLGMQACGKMHFPEGC